MANDNLAKQLSSSWSWTGGPTNTVDNILLQMQAQGQSFFQASGDGDAYTGANPLDNVNATVAPVDSTNLTCVGGTTLTMNGSGASYASEQVWNYAPYGGSDANVGSSGGTSAYYAIPWWQTNVNMASNSGSTSFRNIPDVALTADQVFVCYNNGSSNGFAGTSCAAPLWAGFCALVNQASVAAGGSTMGFINPALYAIANSPSYSVCFNDIMTGNNVGTGTPGLYQAVPGYDLCTGLGTPNGTNLINALIPAPHLISQPVSQTVTNGGTAVFSAAASGQSPLHYAWRFNGTNLPGSGNVSGVNSNVLTLTSVTTNNAGGYSVVVTNTLGSVTSSVATLTISFPPTFTSQPTNQSVVAGNSAVFSATVSGGLPLSYQWRKNGTNVVNGPNIAGATSNVLTLTAVVATNAGNYTLIATNVYGAVTSSVASLTVFLPAAITTPPSPQTVQCSSNASFSVTASGTSPLKYQWSLDAVPINGATNSSLSLTNVHLPSHTVAVVVTNLYGSATNSVTLTVQDTLPPVVTLNGSNPFYVELGKVFIDPGATANDLCAGVVPAVASGSVNTNALSTNTVTYTANDGNGNMSTATRTVIVRDTTPPSITWSFTNLTLAAGTNCTTTMPNVTGTNFIQATDASGTLIISQTPSTNSALSIGTNVVVITVADPSSNTAYSTNKIVVQDQTPPQILVQPLSQTNSEGGNALFSVTANACTPLAFQWYFTNSVQSGETNSTLMLTNLTTGAQGDYFVVVSASGGSSTSAVATLTVNVVPSSIATVAENADHSVTLGLSGAVGGTYVVDATTNILGGWVPIATNTMGTNGAAQFTDPEAANFQQRFYRLRAGP
jgi:hypothetical protein